MTYPMIQLDTLGAVGLRRDGSEVRSVLTQPRRLALLIYLATARPRGYHSRDRLLGLFWPESDEERARNSLRQALHQLRRSLGPAVLVARGDREIGVDPAGLRCDAVAFDEAIEAGRPAAALQLYRGEFLPGFFLEGAPAVERFLEEERARYRRAAVAAAWQLATAAEAAHDLRAAGIHARQAFALDPDDEPGLRRALDLLDRAGERVAALQLYDDFATRLERELELTPAPETLLLVERLRAPLDAGAVARTARTGDDAPVYDAPAAAATPSARDTAPIAAQAGAGARAVPQDDTGDVHTGSVTRKLPWQGAHRRWRLLLGGAALGVLVIAGGLVFRARGPAQVETPDVAAEETSAIAVLPFVNMSGDPANEYLADGLAEELIYALSRVRGVNVVGHTSAFSFKGKDIGVDSIGRALRVGHVLEGSVRITGSRVRILATLVDARSGYHRWSETYDAELDNVLALQDRISTAIVGALRPQLAAVLSAVDRPEMVDPMAHADVLRGLQALRLGAPDDYARADTFFTRAVRRDPSYGRAHAGLALVYMSQAMLGILPRAGGYARAAASANLALSLDSGLSEAHGVLGRIAMEHEWDYGRADEHFRRAIALSPGSEMLYRQRARLLSVLGRHDEAVALAQRSVELDPIAPGAYRWLGLILHNARRHDAALEAFDRALALTPDHAYSLAYRSYVLLAQQRYREAVEDTERALAAAPEDLIVLAAAAAANAAAGEVERADELLARLENQPQPNAFLLAEALVRRGDYDRVFQLLFAAASARDPFLVEVGVAPAFDALREDARMSELLARLGLG